MNKDTKILFSPIGTTDPIANSRDGAMLHICRVYKPQKIYLFMSKEMCELQEKDNRYVYSLEKLGEELDVTFDIHLLEEKELENVHVLDDFYQRFSVLLEQIHKENPTSQMLINVSSGTPAMKSALQVLANLSDVGSRERAIQVGTPRKRSNGRRDDINKYEKELEWEYNEDNQPGFENRCIESTGESFLIKIKKQMIKNQIDGYDYVAALAIADEIKGAITPTQRMLLEAAKCRIQLDYLGVNQCLKGTDFKEHIIPVRANEIRPLLEYVLNLKIKLKKQEYADFIRSITPVFCDLQENTLEACCGIKLDDYVCQEKERKVRKWSIEKLQSNEMLYQVLKDAHNGSFREVPVGTYHLQLLIDAFCKEEYERLKNKLGKLKEIEESVRNIAAHEIVSVTVEWIKNKTGVTPEEILSLIIGIIQGIPNITNGKGSIPPDYWKSYDHMNQIIKENLRELVE